MSILLLDIESAGKELVEAARLGDAKAQTAIFVAYKERVAGQIYRMTGDCAVVDDLLQEVFMAVFMALPQFRGTARLSTWLYSITANKVRNWQASFRRRNIRECCLVHDPQEPSPTPEEQAACDEHCEKFREELAKLSPVLREAFIARIIKRMNVQKAAKYLGVPPSTLSYRTRKAERLLCSRLGIVV